MAKGTLNLVIAIALIVIGLMMVLGKLGIEGIIGWLGIVLVVLGILILIGKFPGGTLVGVAVLVIGVLLMMGILPGLHPSVKDALWIVNLVLGVVLIVLGIQRLR